MFWTAAFLRPIGKNSNHKTTTHMQYNAEITYAEAYGMNPSGFILRGSDGQGGRPLGFIEFGSETHEALQKDLEKLWSEHQAGVFGPGNCPDGYREAFSKLVDSYLPSPY